MINDKQTTPADGPKIGIIGGLAFRAGVYYYERISNRCAENNQRLELLLNHASIESVLPLVNAGDKAALGTYLGALANELFDAGVASVSVTAIAPHIAIDEIRRKARGHVVSALDMVESTIRSQGIEKVAVFGNKAVMATDIFGAVSSDLVVTLSLSEQERIHQTYMDIALNGKRGTKPEVEYFNSLADDIMNRAGVQAIVLAGTDLSSFYAAEPPEYPFLDMAQLHIEQILTQR